MSQQTHLSPFLAQRVAFEFQNLGIDLLGEGTSLL
jgi:hypothetical protein